MNTTSKVSYTNILISQCLPEEEVAQKEKDIPEETEETKTYGPGINAAKNKCK